jgi:hypothetical protein
MAPAAAMTDGFPLWVSITHFLNLMFMALMARSGSATNRYLEQRGETT